MSNYNLKAKNKLTGEIVEFYAMDNYFGNRRYGYQELLRVSSIPMNDEQFNELYEVIPQTDLGINDDTSKKDDILEDPNHPYGGMTTNWREEFKNNFVSLQPDGTEGWGIGLYLNDKVMPENIQDFITTLLEKQREEYNKKIEYVMKKDEQVHGCQYNDKNEIDIYFDGFKDGRAMMRIDLLKIIKPKLYE